MHVNGITRGKQCCSCVEGSYGLFSRNFLLSIPPIFRDNMALMLLIFLNDKFLHFSTTKVAIDLL